MDRRSTATFSDEVEQNLIELFAVGVYAHVSGAGAVFVRDALGSQLGRDQRLHLRQRIDERDVREVQLHAPRLEARIVQDVVDEHEEMLARAPNAPEVLRERLG